MVNAVKVNVRGALWEGRHVYYVVSSYHIETSQLISCVNQLTGFYMMKTLAFNELTK